MYKIYESDNYIIVTKVENGETFYGHKKNVFIDKNNTNKPFYSIFNVKDFKEDTVLKIGEIQKQDGTLYTEAEFDTFYRTNTGNFNGGGTAPTGDFLSNDETSYIDATLPLAGTELALVEQGGTFKKVEVSDLASNKLDKVTTNDVEKVYIKNADGTQSTKPTSDFGTVKGTGTINRISKFTASGTIGDSQIFDNGTNVGIGTTTPSQKLEVVGNTRITGESILGSTSGLAIIRGDNQNAGTGGAIQISSSNVATNQYIAFGSGLSGTGAFTERMRVLSTGNVGIGTTTPQARLDVRAQGVLNTDIVLRVRNSTDTQNFLVVNGAGDVYNNGAKGVNTNTFFGENVGRNATGVYNTAIGTSALGSNTTGNSNAAIGAYALFSNTTGTNNTAIGRDALGSNTTGVNNTAIGTYALLVNTIGYSNAAIGRDALRSNTIGYSNAAIGRDALGSNTTGNSNAAIGNGSLYNNTTGNSNMAIGVSALFANTTGNSNMAIGVSALGNNTTGVNNTAIGTYALLVNTTGNSNTAIGREAGKLISNGSNNTITNNSIFIGSDTRALADNQTNQIVIGDNAIGQGSNSVVLGNKLITITQLRGQVIMGAFDSAPTGIEGAIYYDYSTKKHRGFNGDGWNDLY